MARLNKKVPQTVTYQGLSYELVERKATAPVTVTFKGAQYKRICAEQLPTPHPWVDNRGKGTRKYTSTPFSLDDEYMPSPVVEDIYVRMSQSDYHLLASLPQAVEGHLQGLLQRVQSKKLNSGRAEVLASEAEVKAAIAALEEFVQSEDDENPDVVHAQDMLSTWKRNYIIPDKSLSKPLPTYKSELPPSSNIRMFHYKGARYVLVRADEAPDYMGKRKSPTLEEVIDADTEVFSELFIKGIQDVIAENVPIMQIKDSIDKVQNARQSLDNVSMALNNDRGPGGRWLTDAFFSGKHHRDTLRKLIQNPDLVRESINKYLNDMQKAGKSIQVATKVLEDVNKMIVERGWASKWALKRGRGEATEEILNEFYGLDAGEIKAFMNNAYNIINETRSKKKSTPGEEAPKERV